eukprot:90336_1
MPTRTRGRKRRRSTENEKDSNPNHNKKQKTESNASNPAQLVELSEYFCCVCKELSCLRILQCPNGCIICENCYPRITPCKCPLCRETMNKNKPIRCRIAERTLALRVVQCKYDGCNQEVMFGKLQEHVTNECKYKPIDCKYKVLGCDWKGLRHNQKQHESRCKCDQNDSLTIVQSLTDKLKYYQKFCNDSAEIHTTSLHVPSEQEFTVDGDDFYVEGYEFKVRVKSEKTRAKKNQEIYQISTQIVFLEDHAQFMEGETIVLELGIVIEPYGSGLFNFVNESKAEISATTRTETEWSTFTPQLSKSEYRSVFKGGFNLKVFCFVPDL